MTDLDQLLTSADPLPDPGPLSAGHHDQLLQATRDRRAPAGPTPTPTRPAHPRRQHRLTAVAGAAVLAAAVTLVATHHGEDTSGPVAGTALDGVTPAAGPIFGELPFTVTEDKETESQPGAASCILAIDLGPHASPRTIGEPCTTFGLTGPPGETPPMSRTDRVKIAGKSAWVITGGVPADAVAVTAISEHGTPLTATVEHPAFSPIAVFAMRTTGHRLYQLRYRLADGTLSPYNDISDPN